MFSNTEQQYLEWLMNGMCRDRFPDTISYQKLFRLLLTTEFKPLIPKDQNRVSDALELREGFIEDWRHILKPDGLRHLKYMPCTILEVMVALATRMENSIMTNPKYGDRTSQWFWMMVSSLGLNGMYDERFDERTAVDILRHFVRREYEPNGVGGLFTIRNTDKDLREVEIWVQMLWFLDTLV